MNPIALLVRAAIPSVSFRLPLRRALDVSRERRALAQLSAHELRDIGLEPGDAEHEARRGFFDLPHRR